MKMFGTKSIWQAERFSEPKLWESKTQSNSINDKFFMGCFVGSLNPTQNCICVSRQLQLRADLKHIHVGVYFAKLASCQVCCILIELSWIFLIKMHYVGSLLEFQSKMCETKTSNKKLSKFELATQSGSLSLYQH